MYPYFPTNYPMLYQSSQPLFSQPFSPFYPSQPIFTSSPFVPHSMFQYNQHSQMRPIPLVSEEAEIHSQFLSYVENELKKNVRNEEWVEYMICLMKNNKCKVRVMQIIGQLMEELSPEQHFHICKHIEYCYPSHLDYIEEYKKISLIDKNQLKNYVKLIISLMKICDFAHKSPYMTKQVGVEYVLNGIILNLYLHQLFAISKWVRILIDVVLEDLTVLNKASICQKMKYLFYLLIQNEYEYNSQLLELQLVIFKQSKEEKLFTYLFHQLQKQFQISLSQKDSQSKEPIDIAALRILAYRQWSYSQGVELVRLIQNYGTLTREGCDKGIKHGLKAIGKFGEEKVDDENSDWQ